MLITIAGKPNPQYNGKTRYKSANNKHSSIAFQIAETGSELFNEANQ